LRATLTLDRWVPKWTPFLYAILVSILRNRPCGSDRQYLRARKPVPSCLQCSPSFSLFQRPPSSTINSETKKPRLRSWKVEPNPTAIREGPTERKTTGSTIRGLRGIKIRCWAATCCKGSVSLGPCELRDCCKLPQALPEASSGVSPPHCILYIYRWHTLYTSLVRLPYATSTNRHAVFVHGPAQ
jgi:hypothetical protein